MVSKAGGTLVLAFLASLLVLFIIGTLSYRAVRTLTTNNERVTHTQDVLEDLQEIRTFLLQIETDARGYLLTGDEIYFNAYDNEIREIPVKISALKEKTKDNESHQQKFVTLEKAVESRLALLDEFVQKRQVLGASVIPQGQSPEGKIRMGAVKSALDSIAVDERALLAERSEQSRQSAQQLLVTLVLSFLGVFALLCVIYYLVRRDVAERNTNAANLEREKNRLEDRVRERTAELNETNEELERSNRELQDFAFVASHDLQEPLRKIQAFGDRLRTVQADKFDEKGLDYLTRMQNAAERMHLLINDLLTYSRVTTKAAPFVETDLNKIAKGVVSDLEVRIEESGASVTIGELPTIDADAMQMRQLFQNLIANALKFQSEDIPPSVVVNSSVAESNGEDGESISISVADNGIGFDEKYLDRIFTPFQRLHGRNEFEGTGIGLAVCRKIAERHGGNLTAKSSPGEGATFIVTLPLKQK